jgi:CDP-diacylglycerol--serine O-phosphatidyltransferase
MCTALANLKNQLSAFLLLQKFGLTFSYQIWAMIRQLPNLITLLNLLCGAAALLSTLQGQYTLTAWFLLAGAVADFGDGLVARALGVSSPVGKQLDSLADLLSFGLVPGAILYVLLSIHAGADPAAPLQGQIVWSAFPAFVLTAASALRLARFNLDERQTEGFLGLATPACTLLVLGWLLAYQQDVLGMGAWLVKPVLLYPLIGVLSALLLSEIPMFSFKFKDLRWEGNAIRFIFAALSLVLVASLQELALAPIVLSYIVINLLRYLVAK